MTRLFFGTSFTTTILGPHEPGILPREENDTPRSRSRNAHTVDPSIRTCGLASLSAESAGLIVNLCGGRNTTTWMSSRYALRSSQRLCFSKKLDWGECQRNHDRLLRLADRPITAIETAWLTAPWR